jgi:hypothetical protein
VSESTQAGVLFGLIEKTVWDVAHRHLSSSTQHRQPPVAGDQRQLVTVIPVPQYTTHAFGLGALIPGG